MIFPYCFWCFLLLFLAPIYFSCSYSISKLRESKNPGNEMLIIRLKSHDNSYYWLYQFNFRIDDENDLYNTYLIFPFFQQKLSDLTIVNSYRHLHFHSLILRSYDHECFITSMIIFKKTHSISKLTESKNPGIQIVIFRL